MLETKKIIFLLLTILLLPLLLLNICGCQILKKQRLYEKQLLGLSKKLHKLYLVEIENKALLKKYEQVDPSYLHSALESFKPSSSNPIEFIEKISDACSLYQEKSEKS